MKIKLTPYNFLNPRTGTVEHRHALVAPNYTLMTTRTLIGSGARPLLGDFEGDFLITGSQYLSGVQVLSIEQVNTAFHLLVPHKPWQRDESNIIAEFELPGGNLTVNAGPKGRLIRLNGQSSSAWIGRNRAKGFYFAGLDSLDDVYLRTRGGT